MNKRGRESVDTRVSTPCPVALLKSSATETNGVRDTEGLYSIEYDTGNLD